VKSVRRPLSTRGILGLILLALALPVIALGLSVPILVQRRWERMQAECRTQEAELRARDPRRPVLRGEAVQGDAWEVYARAFKQLLAAGIPYQDFDYIDHPELIDSESLQVLTERSLPTLELALSGTRRAECRNLRDWEGTSAHMLGFWRLTAPIFRARHLSELGHARKAIELLLDMVRLNGDLARGTPWTEANSPLWQQMRCLNELKALMSTGILDPDDLRQLARELEILDADVPRFGEGMRLAAMEAGFQIHRAQTIEALFKEFEMGSTPIPFWKRGSLGRLTLVNWYDLVRTTGTKVAEGDLKSWPEAASATRRASAELEASGNFLLSLWVLPKSKVDYIPIHKMFRDALAQLRLLRAAALYSSDGTLPDAEDPYGGPLRWSKKGPVFRLWSRGVDGVDDGGSGGWNPKSSRDIVLEVRR